MTFVDQGPDDYVEIARHIRDLGDEVIFDATSRRLLRALDTDGRLTLAKRLEDDKSEPLVLIAPSGTGKTTEFQRQARRLRSIGRTAVYSEALGIIASPEMDLDEDERVALADAISGQKRGVLFIDALDELQLRQRSLEELFRRLWREIDFTEHPLRLVFSARNSA